MLQKVNDYVTNGFGELEDLNIFALPINQSIIQNWNLIILSEQHIACQAEEGLPICDNERKYEIAHTITRPVIIQYLNKVRSISSWYDIWLVEALTTYLQYKFLDQINTAWRVMDLFVVQLQHASLWMNLDFNSEEFTAGIDQGSATLNRIFIPPTFKKAPFLMRMLEHILPKEIFRSHLFNYQQTGFTLERFWNITYRLHTVTALYNFTLRTLMDEWLNRPFHPVLYVRRCKTKVWIMEKQQEENTNNCINRWIPITYATEKKPDFNDTFPKLWLRPCEESSIRDASDGWIIINVQQVGYYRVNYDEAIWKMIIDYMDSEKYINIHVLNRAQLIDDAYFFMQNGDIEPEIFFDLIKYLKRETDYIAWFPMKKVFSDLWHLYQKDTKCSSVKIMILELLQRLINFLGFTERAADDKMMRDMRIFALELACNLGHLFCIDRAHKQLESHFTKNLQISPKWERWTYCMGLMADEFILFKEIVNEYKNTKKENLLYYLACSQNRNMIRDFILILPDMRSTLEDTTLLNVYTSIAKRYANNDDEILSVMLSNLMELKPRTVSVEYMLNIIIQNLYKSESLVKVYQYALSNKLNATESALEEMIEKQNHRINAVIYECSLYNCILG